MWCWLPTQIICSDRDTTAQIPARTAGPPGYPLPDCFPNTSPTTVFSSLPAAGAFQRGNPIGHSMQNTTMHEDKTDKSCGNGTNTFESMSTESPSSTPYRPPNTNISVWPSAKTILWQWPLPRNQTLSILKIRKVFRIISVPWSWWALEPTFQQSFGTKITARSMIILPVKNHSERQIGCCITEMVVILLCAWLCT